MYDDDGCTHDPYSFCSSLSVAYTGSKCQDLYLYQGCAEDETCSGQMTVTTHYTNPPTKRPTSNPTKRPTSIPTSIPSSIPTSVAESGFSCPTISDDSTEIYFASGESVNLSYCGNSCSGSDVVSVTDPSGNIFSFKYSFAHLLSCFIDCIVTTANNTILL